MTHDDTFLAAYVLLLARLWQELERLLALLQSAASSEYTLVRAEIFRLELVLLRQSLEGPRLPLGGQECARVRAMVDWILKCDVQRPAAIEDAQDLLFEEIQDLMTRPESFIRNVA